MIFKKSALAAVLFLCSSLSAMACCSRQLFTQVFLGFNADESQYALGHIDVERNARREILRNTRRICFYSVPQGTLQGPCVELSQELVRGDDEKVDNVFPLSGRPFLDDNFPPRVALKKEFARRYPEWKMTIPQTRASKNPWPARLNCEEDRRVCQFLFSYSKPKDKSSQQEVRTIEPKILSSSYVEVSGPPRIFLSPSKRIACYGHAITASSAMYNDTEEFTNCVELAGSSWR